MQGEDVDCSVFSSVLSIVSGLKSMRADDRKTTELECRFGSSLRGKCGSTMFNSSVSFTFFNTVMTMLNDYSSWTKVIDWREITDYFYKAEGYDELRSRIEVVEGSPLVQTMKKTRTRSERYEIMVPSENDQMFRYISPPSCIRVSVNDEDPIDTNEIPDVAEVHTTRIIHRKTFILNQYRYEISKVWMSKGAESIVDCQRKKESETPAYEIELEVDLSSAQFEMKSSNYLAMSFLYKILSVMNNSVRLKAC